MTISKKEQTQLTKFGFDTDSAINDYNRLIMAVEAFPKGGKTAFALSAPKPMSYLNFDRKIEQSTLDLLGVARDDLYVKEIRINGDLAQDQHRAEWDQVCGSFMWMLRDSEDIRTIVVDTETEMWELARLAYFGKTTQVMPYMYTELNSVYKYMIDQCDKYDKNIIFLRKVKKEYKNDKWSGKHEVAGFSKLDWIVEVNARMGWDGDEEEFWLEIINNGITASMNGQEFTGEMVSFPWVAAMLTGTTPDEWE